MTRIVGGSRAGFESGQMAWDGTMPASIVLALLFVGLALAEALWPLVRTPIEGRGRLATNLALGGVNLIVATLLPLTAPATALIAARRGWGVLNATAAPGWAAIAISLLAMSLLQYGFHRAAHHWAWLWRIHRVHHADTAVDLSTTLRNHPAELVILVPAQAALALALGLSAPALLAYQTFALGFGLWTHANLAMSERHDRWLRWLVVTPVMHHRHHSAVRAETDSNYGDVLSLWDRLFGSYDPAPPAVLATMRRGLGDATDARAAHFGAQLFGPFRRG